MVHGWACPGDFFHAQTDALRSRARCIVPDLPGHGKTADRLPLTIDSAGDAIQAYLIEHDLKDVVLCGWSMGALVVYSLLERHGAERISSVVAIDMSPKAVNDADWQHGSQNGLTAEVNALVLDNMIAQWAAFPEQVARQMFAAGRPVDPDLMAFAQSEIARGNPVLLKAMWASLTDQDFRAFLRDFPVPLHLAVGLHSQLYGPGMYRWHEENVPDLHLHEFANSGHSPHLEEPERFNRLLTDLVTA
ncbi:pimeloyl-[acyl-carrier protein] methyl ester esterase [Roseibium marinum]|uniref:Pimeloyl-[acyl-carrier protein] methyl ester esterase n=2 Tax=Roseibium marinum TaxID=281252 RepID=A0A2S3ULI6_9HYPH|nr:pimeloyl-[acyl-carrier protein] methyl ester esterase [Roseibium marinum]